jgi:hypothetical protein
MDPPSLQQMLRAALSPATPFDVVLVDATSRLSRSTESVLSIYRQLNFAGLQLISVSQGPSIAAMSESSRRKPTAADRSYAVGMEKPYQVLGEHSFPRAYPLLVAPHFFNKFLVLS